MSAEYFNPMGYRCGSHQNFIPLPVFRLTLPFLRSRFEWFVVAVGAKCRVFPVDLGVLRFPPFKIVVGNADAGPVGG